MNITPAPPGAPAPAEAPPNSACYEAPTIENVVSFDDLQREVLYAGVIGVSDANVPPIPTPTP